MPLITPDVSEFQVTLDHSYPRDFVILRASFGAGYQDKRFLANAAAAAELYRQGRIAGVILYHVYLPGLVKAQFDFFWSLVGPTVPDWLAGVMIDVETWRGQSYEIRGDHSAEINDLAGRHAHRLGSFDAVLAYGNAGDLAQVYPHRDKRVRVVQASYASRIKLTVPGAIGQQYTDGSSRWPSPKGLPTVTKPFGRCDHNVFPAFANGKALRAALRPVPGKHATPPPAPKPPAKPVAKPPAPRPHYPHANVAAHDHALVAPAGAWALILGDDGRLDLRHNGIHVRYL